MQPLDVGVFHAFKITFGQLQEEIVPNPRLLNGKDNKIVLAILVSKVMVAACNPKNIRFGFKKTYIFLLMPRLWTQTMGQVMFLVQVKRSLQTRKHLTKRAINGMI
jgi:hypothetical protein